MFRFRVTGLVVGLLLMRGAIDTCALEPTSGESEKRAELRLAVAYPVESLPVWQMRDGKPQFDASVVIAYLKSFVDTSTLIFPIEQNGGMLEILASESEHEKLRRAMLPLWAFGGDIEQRLKQKIADASISSQKVLVLASDPNSAAVKKFFDLQSSDENSEFQTALENYLVQCIPVQQNEHLQRLGITRPDDQDATLAMLNADGTLETQVKFSDIESTHNDLAETLSQFLRLHQPTFPDARDVLASGYERARRDQKRVWLVVSGTNCGPCVVLSRLLAAQHELFEKDYVVVKLDSRMTHGTEVINQIRVAGRGPIPWIAVLEANGDLLATGDGPNGNIGYPSTDQDRDHFQNMLRQTRQRLTDEDISSIMKGLDSHLD